MSTKKSRTVTKRRKKQVQPEQGKAQVQPEAETPARNDVQQPSSDFERELEEHFAAETRKKVEEATENIFGSLLARHRWARNEHGEVEYVGGDGA